MSERSPYEGSLEDLDFPDLARVIILTRGTGQLTLSADGVDKTVVFADGDFRYATSSDDDDRLGEYLLCRGVIERDHLDDVAPMIARGHRVGSILVEREILTPQQLKEHLSQQVLEIILSLFEWTRGRYGYTPAGGEPASAMALQVSTPDVVLKGVRRIQRWSRVERGAGHPGTIYRLTGELDRFTLPMELTPEEWGVLGLFKTPLSLTDLCAACRLSEFRSLQIVWAFRTLGCLRFPSEFERSPVRDFLRDLTSTPPAASSEREFELEHPEMVGIQVPDTTSRRSGSLTGLTLPDVLRELYLGRRSGVLRATSGGYNCEIYLSHGTIVGARSSSPEHRIGEIAVRRGMLGHDLLEKLLAERAAELMGQTLLQQGLLSPEQLDRLVEAQIRAILRPMFSWKEGQYEIEEGVPPRGELPASDLSVAEVILDGVRSMDDFAGIADFLSGVKLTLKPSSDPQLRYQKARLRPGEGYLLSRIDGHTSFEELCILSPSDQQETTRIIYGLLAAGLIELGSHKDKEGAAASAPEPAAAPPVAATEEQASSELAPLSSDEIRRAAGSFDGLDHHQILGLEADSGPEVAARACEALARYYHPDRGRTREDREILDTVFARVVEAGRVLTDPALRSEYENLLEPQVSEAGPLPSEPLTEQPPEADDQTPTQAAALAYRRGIMAFEGNAFLEAVHHLREAVRLQANNAAYKVKLADVLARNPRRSKEAEQELLAAIELEPWLTSAYVKLGRLYRRAGLRRKAESMFRQALSTNPENVRARAELESLVPDASQDKGTLGGLFRRMVGVEGGPDE